MPTAKAAANTTAVAKVTNRLKGNLGSSIDDLFKLRERKRLAEETVKAIEVEINAAQEILMERLDKEKLDKATGALASVSISTAITANVEDWDTFNAWVKKTGHFHLYQKRISDAAYREVIDSGKKVPGVQPFSKRRLNLRVISK